MIEIPMKDLAYNQPHVDEAVIDTIASQNADILVIEYLYSALLCPRAIKTATRAVLVTQNNETDFYWRFLKSVTKSRFKMVMKSMRLIHLWLTEQSIFSSMEKIIGLKPLDAPKSKGTYITPYLDSKLQQWQPNASRTIFFVGNITHYPNREAIEYIITKLAPAVTVLLPDVRFTIIGASSADVSFHHPSVNLLGNSDVNEIERQFLHCQLFICPIKNPCGVKFKIIEALSYGTPFLASPESMLAFPYLKGQETLFLNNPAQVAKTIAAAIKEEASSINLAKNIQFFHQQFTRSQKNVWSRVLNS